MVVAWGPQYYTRWSRWGIWSVSAVTHFLCTPTPSGSVPTAGFSPTANRLLWYTKWTAGWQWAFDKRRECSRFSELEDFWVVGGFLGKVVYLRVDEAAVWVFKSGFPDGRAPLESELFTFDYGKKELCSSGDKTDLLPGDLDLFVVEGEALQIPDTLSGSDTSDEFFSLGGNVDEPKVVVFGPQEEGFGRGVVKGGGF
jgi:hypothetical protein